MDSAIKNMDFPVKEWGSYRRRFPAAFPLILMDFIRHKRHWMRHAFGTCNFSLILRGRGEYRRFGRQWTVQAPCVVLQWPGEHVEYGPLAPDGTWDELYLMYDGTQRAAFEAQRLADPGEPVWPILNLPAVEARIAELLSVAASPAPMHVADRVDRLCELLILETHLQPPEPADGSDPAVVVRRMERELASHLDQDIDLDELAARYGMSLSTFRRRWAEVINVPPARYRLQVRLREAGRLLRETARPVYEVARTVGFPDELYFSRRFHRELKLSPRAYRRRHQAHREASRA
jgi:AraC-like DNA-binding protein